MPKSAWTERLAKQRTFLCIANECSSKLNQSAIYEIGKTIASELGCNASDVEITPAWDGKEVKGKIAFVLTEAETNALVDGLTALPPSDMSKALLERFAKARDKI